MQKMPHEDTFETKITVVYSFLRAYHQKYRTQFTSQKLYFLHFLSPSVHKISKNKTMDIRERYSKYDSRTQEWMSKMISDLESDLGTIPESYIIQLDLCADSFNLYNQAKDNITQNGILVSGRKGEQVKNPSVALLNSTQLFIAKLLNSFAMTRTSKARLSKELTEESSAPIDEWVK